MKTFKLKQLLYLFTIGLTSTFFSCEKSIINPSQTDVNSLKQQIYSKKVILKDASSETMISLLISSEDASLINEYTEDNFSLVCMKKGDDFQTKIRNLYPVTEEDEGEENSSNEENDIVEGVYISFEVISEELGTDITHYAITFIQPESMDARGWKYYTHYSNKDCATIEKHNFWRRVYYGMYYKLSSTGGWNTLITSWRKLNNNESYSRCQSNSYKMKVKVRTKRSTSYTVYFES